MTLINQTESEIKKEYLLKRIREEKTKLYAQKLRFESYLKQYYQNYNKHISSQKTVIEELTKQLERICNEE